MAELERRLSENYITRDIHHELIEQVEAKANQREKEAEQARKEILNFETDMSVAYGKFCTELIESKLRCYEQVCQSFACFFDSEDLKLHLSRKAEIT